MRLSVQSNLTWKLCSENLWAAPNWCKFSIDFRLIQFNAIPEMNILFITRKQDGERRQICPNQESLNTYQVNGYIEQC